MKVFIAIAFISFNLWCNAQPKHNLWDGLLKKSVSIDGVVDYAEFKNNEAVLDQYLKLLANQSPQRSWTKFEEMAYWVNAYNAYTVKLILNNSPLTSIMDLQFDGKNAWDYKWIAIAGQRLSLNDIEHKKLRGQFQDARIHFVVNCASFSCPILLNKAFTAENIDLLMSQQAALFINDRARNQISAKSPKLSRIFEWYAEDFIREAGSVQAYVNRFSPIKLKSNTALGYMDYNWSLNGK
jgi:hypothetical protein